MELFVYDFVMNLEMNISFTYWMYHLAAHWLIASTPQAENSAFHLKCGFKMGSDVEVTLSDYRPIISAHLYSVY